MPVLASLKACCDGDDRTTLDHLAEKKNFYCDGVDHSLHCTGDPDASCSPEGSPCPPNKVCSDDGVTPCTTLGDPCGVDGTCVEGPDRGDCVERGPYTGTTGWESEVPDFGLWVNGTGSVEIRYHFQAAACREAVEELPDPESEEELGRSPPPLLTDRIRAYVGVSVITNTARAFGGSEKHRLTESGSMTDITGDPDVTEREQLGPDGGGSIDATLTLSAAWAPPTTVPTTAWEANACYWTVSPVAFFRAEHADGTAADFAIHYDGGYAFSIEGETSDITCCEDKATFVYEDIDP